MQKAEIILSIIREKSSDEKFLFKRLYRILYNESFYTLEEKNYDNIVDALKHERYESISKKSSWSKEILRTIIKILEAIYCEKNISYGYHYFNYLNEAIVFIKNNLNNFKSIIIFDINLQKINPVLIKLLKKRIDDQRFLNLFTLLINIKECYKYFKTEINHLIFFILFNELLRNNKEEGILFVAWENQIVCMIKDDRLVNDIIDYFHVIDDDNTMNISKTCAYSKDANIFGLNIFYSKKLKKVKVLIPQSAFAKSVRRFTKNNKPFYLALYINLPVEKIIDEYMNFYSREFEKFAVADNYKYIKKRYRYILYSSLLRTIARKENASVKKTYYKYRDQIEHILNQKPIRGVSRPESRIHRKV